MVGEKMENVIIRDASAADAGRLLEIYSYYIENTAITFEYDVPTLEEFRARIVNTTKRYPYLVLEEDGKIMGYVYANLFKTRAAYARCCESSIYLDRNATGKGYGRMLYEELFERLKKLGVLNLYAIIASPIVPDEYLTKNSEYFHAHIGFRNVGELNQCGYKFNRWYNTLYMEKMLGEHN